MESTIEPFVYLAAYKIVVCKVCQLGCVANEVTSHLMRQHQSSMSATARARTAEAVGQLQGIIRDQAGLGDFRFPPPDTAAISLLPAPRTDGLRCRQCGHVGTAVRKMQQHCREQHGWRNDWAKGGDVAKRSRQERQPPWTTDVRCQRFFRSRAASGWFEVEGAREPSGPAAAAEAVEAAEEDGVQRAVRMHREQARRFAAAGREAVRVADDRNEPNAWVERTGWAQHLRGLDPDRLRTTVQPIGEEEALLQSMWESLERVLDRARSTATAGRVGSAVLFEVGRKDVHVKPSRPFDNRLEADTWVRYKHVWRTLLCIWQRTQDWDDEDRPPYQLTVRQGDLYDAFEDAAEAAEAGGTVRLDRLCVDMVVGLLDHQFGESHYDSMLLSGLAVMGLRAGGGWMGAADCTPIYSAVVKVARMLVVYLSYLEHEDEVAERQRAAGLEEGREQARSMFSSVRDKVRRFMTRVSDGDGAEPTPMDWILDTRTYGMRINFTTAADGSIDWDGDYIVYGRVRFSMGQLSDMLHTLVEEARSLLGQLAMADDGDTGALPAVEWTQLEDDHSEERVGYSFLQDERNV
jgi:hypothetical protein